MEYKSYNCKAYNIHTVKTDKFKTVRMEIVFRREVKKEDMQAYTFLCDLMSDVSKMYPKRRDMVIKLEELYKAYFYATTNKVGNLFTISFCYEFIDPIYINEDNYLEEVIKFPFEVIKNPNVENNEFDLVAFNNVKRRMKRGIEGLRENPIKYAINAAFKNMDKNSPTSYRVTGDLEGLNKITRENLYNYYLELLNSTCDIFVIGNLDMDKTVQIIKKNFDYNVISTDKYEIDIINKERKKPLVVKEKLDFVQSTLVMIFNINGLDEKDKLFSFHVFNYIFGDGGISSKLYQKIRVDKSYCYSIRSMYLKYDNLLLITTSLDNENVENTKKLVIECLNDMASGNFGEDDIVDAKKNLILSLKMALDNNYAIMNNLEFKVFSELPLPEERVEFIQNVSKEDVMRVAKKIKLNTVFVLESK